MTNIQSMMLAVCFGAVVGFIIGNVIGIIKFAIDECREKKRSRNEKQDNQ